MKIGTIARVVTCAALVTGCVSTETHKQTLAELEEARKGAAQTAAAFESFKKQAAAEAADLKKQLADAITHITALEQENVQLTAANTRLLSGTTTAQEEIARLQKRAGELEAERARANDLAKRLAERDQEIARLQQERDQLSAQARKQQDAIQAAQQEQDRLQALLKQQEERLKTEESEKARLEQERAAKEAEIQRLTRTHEELTKSLEDEIAKGDIKIKQVKDRLTINMVDRVLFDSGQSHVKPTGLKVLKQVSDILKNVTDKQIRIEGHTDNVPIGAKLKERFPTNWELSTARATSVVRYLIEEGGVDRANLSAVGYADTKPIAGNDAEDGRTANRRIEIALYPKDLSEIASQLKP